MPEECSWLMDELRANVAPGQPWPQSVRVRVAEHLRSCESCREQYTRDWAVAQETRVREDLEKRYNPDEIWRNIQATLQRERQSRARRILIPASIGLSAAAVLALFFFWPFGVTPGVSDVRIVQLQLPGGGWLDWETHGKQRASFPEGTLVKLAPMPTEDRSLLVFDGRAEAHVLPLSLLEKERWEIMLHGPELASFIIIDSPEGDRLSSELREVLDGARVDEGVLLAFANGDVRAEALEIRGTAEPPRPPGWAKRVAEILKRHGLKAQGLAVPIERTEDEP